jgi:hypothetical protein
MEVAFSKPDLRPGGALAMWELRMENGGWFDQGQSKKMV